MVPPPLRYAVQGFAPLRRLESNCGQAQWEADEKTGGADEHFQAHSPPSMCARSVRRSVQVGPRRLTLEIVVEVGHVLPQQLEQPYALDGQLEGIVGERKLADVGLYLAHEAEPYFPRAIAILQR